MAHDVLILADSLNQGTGDRLTTFLLPRFPRCLLAELNTHRVLSRNAESSRAIPIAKRIQKIQADPYIPTFTANQRGMVGREMDPAAAAQAQAHWLSAMAAAIAHAEQLSAIDTHKDMGNRLLEPFARVPVLVSGTNWENFFDLRTAENVNPDFREVAIAMVELYQQRQPQPVPPGGVHIPFDPHWHIDLETGQLTPQNLHLPIKERLMVSAARCARLSYSQFDGTSDIAKDLELGHKLMVDRHWSPFEHQAIATPRYSKLTTANLNGWVSQRTIYELQAELTFEAL
jgi:thymidylate synthase ThyX